MATLFVGIMGIRDVLSEELGSETLVVFLLAAIIGDLITAMIGIQVWSLL